MKTKRDETLEEISAIRRELAKKFDYDPKKAGEYYRRRQKAAGVHIYHREQEFPTVVEAMALRDAPPSRK
ncbi:MAG: hypothetical protein IPM17_14695 [Verrucomicrobia bacterium]|nr:hypothetical protein [Verrucomicrobiota bacterium]